MLFNDLGCFHIYIYTMMNKKLTKNGCCRIDILKTMLGKYKIPSELQDTFIHEMVLLKLVRLEGSKVVCIKSIKRFDDWFL